MMNDGTRPLDRYIPLACWVAVLLTTLLICVKILSYGFVPAGDARRHAAKPFAHKPYSQIVVMRPEYVMDHSPGWEWLLDVLHRTLGWNEDALISFSVTSLVIWIFCLPLFWLRRPEAWMAALLAQTIAIPEVMNRLGQGRPYLLTEGVLIACLFSWSKDESQNPPWPKLAWTTAGFALSAWMHGAWYLWALLPTAFFFAQRWRAGFYLTGCWIAGTFAGALCAGRPFAFLNQAASIARIIHQEHAPQRLLVGEFQPSIGEFGTLTVLALVYLWRKTQNRSTAPLHLQPVFWMIVINWIGGFVADRFWADWGMPAALVWLALQFDDLLPTLWPDGSPRRLLACGLILAPLFLASTNDLGRRYTASLDEPFVDGGNPDLQNWLPEKNGIFYAGNMKFFYNTFYKNPQADWRYMVGFEPALMPPDDLKVFRDIQSNAGAIEAFQPWAEKLRAADRIAFESPSQPVLPPLEWKRAAGDIWIGRLPRK